MRAAGQRPRPAGTARAGAGRSAAALPAALAAAVVGLQIAYPLVGGGARGGLAAVTVVVFFAASVSHALVWRGAAFTGALVAVTAGGGLLVEVLGVNFGLPFGAYAYTGRLGPELAGVPLVIPLAWTMMAYPAFVVALRVTRHRLAGPTLAALALASWDAFLDPQMVAEDLWVWLGGGPSLLGIPLSNFAGWLLVALVMAALLWRPLRVRREVDDRVPYALYLWVYGSSVLGHAVFLGLPGSALAGGLTMGAVVAAFAWAVRRR